MIGKLELIETILVRKKFSYKIGYNLKLQSYSIK